MNYVSVEVLRYAAAIMEAMERHNAEQPDVPALLGCTYQPDPGTDPCMKPAKYLIADGTRVSGGGDIERAPQWRCREYLEHELGEPPASQPIFGRTENPGESE